MTSIPPIEQENPLSSEQEFLVKKHYPLHIMLLFIAIFIFCAYMGINLFWTGLLALFGKMANNEVYLAMPLFINEDDTIEFDGFVYTKEHLSFFSIRQTLSSKGLMVKLDDISLLCNEAILTDHDTQYENHDVFVLKKYEIDKATFDALHAFATA